MSSPASFEERCDQISKSVLLDFNQLTSAQLNWRKTPDSWSIGQCFHHLISSNEKYFPVLERIASGRFKPSFWEKHSPFSKKIGKSMIRNLGITVQNKYKAPKIFLPSSGLISASIIDDFLQHQDRLRGILHEISKTAYHHVVITSPVADLITLPLPDAIEVILNHELRHIEQAKRLLTDPQFPKR